jgi:prevent-host-death family protein
MTTAEHGAMQVISQREMRNRSGEILRAVAAGESFIITNDGVEVAELIPRGAARPKPRPYRPRRADAVWPPLQRRTQTVQEILDELRADRV